MVKLMYQGAAWFSRQVTEWVRVETQQSKSITSVPNPYISYLNNWINRFIQETTAFI